jgi:hypothetical protein
VVPEDEADPAAEDEADVIVEEEADLPTITFTET